MMKMDSDFNWVSVEDRLPEKDVFVLCCGGHGGIFVGKICRDVKNSRASVVLGDGKVRKCAYWMPLPEPPKENYGIKACKNCKHSTWELDGAGDEINYFCCKNTIKLVEKFYCCNEWKNASPLNCLEISNEDK